VWHCSGLLVQPFDDGLYVERWQLKILGINPVTHLNVCGFHDGVWHDYPSIPNESFLYLFTATHSPLSLADGKRVCWKTLSSLDPGAEMP